MRRVRSPPATPEVVSTDWSPSSAVTRTGSAVSGPAARTRTVTAPASTSGRTSSDAMYLRGTGSSHTVCQMPVTAVYQMLCGLATCLPRG